MNTNVNVNAKPMTKFRGTKPPRAAGPAGAGAAAAAGMAKKVEEPKPEPEPKLEPDPEPEPKLDSEPEPEPQPEPEPSGISPPSTHVAAADDAPTASTAADAAAPAAEAANAASKSSPKACDVVDVSHEDNLRKVALAMGDAKDVVVFATDDRRLEFLANVIYNLVALGVTSIVTVGLYKLHPVDP
jgi:outer membrane biosynthesis protein TonB